MKQTRWCIFLIFILLCPLALYSGVIHLKIILYSRFKRKKLELLWIQAAEPLVANYWKNYRIFTIHSQYIYSLLMFVIKKRYLFKSNSDVHNRGTWYNSDLHLPTANPTIFQKDVFYSGIKNVQSSPTVSQKIYHMMFNGLDWLRKEFSLKTPSVLCGNILVVNVMTDLRFLQRCNFLIIFYPVLSSQFKYGFYYMLHYHALLIILICITVFNSYFILICIFFPANSCYLISCLLEWLNSTSVWSM